MMIGPQVVRDQSCGRSLIVDSIVLKADGKCFEPVRCVTDGQRGDHRRIDPTAEENAEFEIGRDQSPSHREAYQLAEAIRQRRWRSRRERLVWFPALAWSTERWRHPRLRYLTPTMTEPDGPARRHLSDAVDHAVWRRTGSEHQVVGKARMIDGRRALRVEEQH